MGEEIREALTRARRAVLTPTSKRLARVLRRLLVALPAHHIAQVLQPGTVTAKGHAVKGVKAKEPCMTHRCNGDLQAGRCLACQTIAVLCFPVPQSQPQLSSHCVDASCLSTQPVYSKHKTRSGSVECCGRTCLEPLHSFVCNAAGLSALLGKCRYAELQYCHGTHNPEPTTLVV